MNAANAGDRAGSTGATERREQRLPAVGQMVHGADRSVGTVNAEERQAVFGLLCCGEGGARLACAGGAIGQSERGPRPIDFAPSGES